MNNLNSVVDSVIETFIKSETLFTALDVSNEVKSVLPTARHRDIRDLVRAAFQSKIEPSGYARTPITVTLTDGSKVDALLYHPLSDSFDLDNKYDTQKRSQTAAHSAPVAAVPTPVAPVKVVSSVVTPAMPTAAVLSARAQWDSLFQSQPSLFPRK